MRRASTTLLACAMLAVTGSVSAAPRPAVVNKSEVLRDFAECVTGVAYGSAVRFLRTEPGSKDEQVRGKTLLTGQWACLHGRPVLSMRSYAIRGPIAEAVFRRDPALLESASEMPGSTPARVPKGLALEPFMVAYAQCLAAAAPAKVAAILRTEPGSPQEHDATLSLGGDLSACMATDVAYHLNTSDLRTHLASALYRVVPGGSAGGGM